MRMIDDKNFITIQGWMINDLKLSSNELLCYALIYGFSQDEQSVFSGSSSYISSWLNISKVSTFSVLKKLCEKGLIEKIEKTINGVKLCDYKALYPIKKLNKGSKETLSGGSKETLYHNIDIYNNKDNIDIYMCENEKNFNEFWTYYPKQRAGSKDKAYKSYLKVIKEKRATHEQLIRSVIAYGKSDEVARGYAKGCSAWLNDDRFLSEYRTTQKQTKAQQTDEKNLEYLKQLWGQ